MKLKELKERIDHYSHESYDDLEVCIPNNKGGMMGGTSVTSVKSANRGIDWDGKKFIISPEIEMIEMVGNPNDYVGFVNHIRRETGMSKNQVIFALEQCKDEITEICSDWFRAHGKKTSSDNRPNSQRGDVNIG